MRKLTGGIVAFFLLFGLGVNSSFADAMDFSIGVSGNYAGYAATGIETHDNATNKNKEEHGAFDSTHPSFFVELDLGMVSVGVDYVPTSISTPQATNVQGTGADPTNSTKLTNNVEADFDDHIMLYALIDLPWYGLYLKGGFSQVEIITKESLGTGGAYGNADTNGMHAGFGAGFEIGDNIFIRGELMVSDYDNASATSSTLDSGEATAKKVEIKDMWGANATISLLKTF